MSKLPASLCEKLGLTAEGIKEVNDFISEAILKAIDNSKKKTKIKKLPSSLCQKLGLTNEAKQELITHYSVEELKLLVDLHNKTLVRGMLNKIIMDISSKKEELAEKRKKYDHQALEYRRLKGSVKTLDGMSDLYENTSHFSTNYTLTSIEEEWGDECKYRIEGPPTEKYYTFKFPLEE